MIFFFVNIFSSMLRELFCLFECKVWFVQYVSSILRIGLYLIYIYFFHGYSGHVICKWHRVGCSSVWGIKQTRTLPQEIRYLH